MIEKNFISITVGNWNFSYQRTFVPGNESSIVWTFVPWNIRSLEHSSPGTFIPLSSPGTFVLNIKISTKLSFPNIYY